MMSKNLPKPSGEYAVGTFTYTIIGHRREVLNDLPKTGNIPEMRSVACRVYHPVLKSSVEGREKGIALSRNMVEGLKREFKIPINYDKETAAGNNFTECYKDAPKIEGKKFPLILFNHGYISYREGNSFLCIDLASHGYVVISVAHSLEGLCTEFDDGSHLFFERSLKKRITEPFIGGMIATLRLPGLKGSTEEIAAKFNEYQYKYSRYMINRLPEWVKDNEAALEYAKENLGDMIDFEKGVGAAGHSMGGNTAYKLCMDKAEIVCGANIDGAPFGDYKDNVQTKPFLQVCCEENENVHSRIYLKHTAPVYKAVFRDMKHVGFSDMKHQIPFGTGKLDANVMHENLCRCHLEFFDAYLKKTKEKPELKNNDAVKYTELSPDIS